MGIIYEIGMYRLLDNYDLFGIWKNGKARGLILGINHGFNHKYF